METLLPGMEKDGIFGLGGAEDYGEKNDENSSNDSTEDSGDPGEAGSCPEGK